MAEFVTGVTFGGTEWTPAYVTDINQKTCIGCGRCFKVCPRDVFDLVEKAEALDPEDFDDDYGDFEDDDDNSMVMSIKNALIVSAAKLAPKCAQKTVLLTNIKKLLNFLEGSRSCPDQKNMYLFVLKTGRKGIPEVLAPVRVVPKS